MLNPSLLLEVLEELPFASAGIAIMEPHFRIYRGDMLLGYAGLDNQEPCKPFWPAELFHEVEHLFARENATAMRLVALEEAGDDQQIESVTVELDEIQAEILAPGVRVESMDGKTSFECLDLNIFDGRICWR